MSGHASHKAHHLEEVVTKVLLNREFKEEIEDHTSHKGTRSA
jgi:hypothetical protein